MEGVNEGDGRNGVGLKTIGETGSGKAAQADNRKPRSRIMPFRIATYLLFSKSSKSGMSWAALRRISKAASVKRSTRSDETECPESASSRTLTILPRKPLARRAQWESTERRSRREVSKRKSWNWSSCAEVTGVLYRHSGRMLISIFFQAIIEDFIYL
jgi:hypothetical protein